MTRRDYCCDCEEAVYDYDVCCGKCGDSYCHDCTVTYDVMTRVAMIQARFRVLCDPFITKDEFDQLMTDVETSEFHTTMNKYCEGTTQPFMDYVHDMHSYDDTTAAQLKHLFNAIELELDIEFVCAECH